MPSEPGRFHTAARHYLQGRPPYAAALIRRVVQLCGVDASCRVLNLGCGPGPLALAFAPFVGEVIGIDPEPEMLRIAREEAARAALRIEFRAGSSGELGADLGTFRLVVIGRAFHWMERRETLARLDQIIEPAGAVVLFGDDHPKVPDNRWGETFERLIGRYAEADAARATWRAPGWLSHEAMLLDSPFPHLERISAIERHATPVERLVDRALSLSSVSHGQVSARADDLAREMREAMTRFARDGLVTEVVESEALIARRMEPAWPDLPTLAPPAPRPTAPSRPR
jgi:SAM-dependent methyltransferase